MPFEIVIRQPRVRSSLVRPPRHDAELVNYEDYTDGVAMSMHNPAHPGETFKELVIEPLGLSITAAAQHLGEPQDAFQSA